MSAPRSDFGQPILPSAIIETIIRLCLSSPITFPPSANDPRLSLILVNKDIRSMVLSPEYWDQVDFLARPVNDEARQIAALRYVVQRSGSNPLSFHFLPDLMESLTAFTLLGRGDLFYGAGAIDIAMNIILPYAPRIRYLNFLLPRKQIRRILCGIPNGALLALEAVDITCFGSFILPMTMVSAMNRCNQFHIFQSLPRLKELSYYDASGICPLDLRLPWNQMAKLDLSNFLLPPDIFINIMRQSRASLVDGYLSVKLDFHSGYLDEVLPDDPVVKMSSLRRLCIRFIDLSLYPTFLEFFTFPCVREFRVERTDRLAIFDWNIHRYMTLLSPSSHSLESLTLATMTSHRSGIAYHERMRSRRRTTSVELKGLLEMLPNLKAICLPLGVYVHVDLWSKIAEGVLLPSCETFEVATDSDPDVITTMLAIRNGHRFNASSSSLLSKISVISHISFVSLTLPATEFFKEMDLRRKLDSLKLAKGYRLHFVRSCAGCHGNCCFGL